MAEKRNTFNRKDIIASVSELNDLSKSDAEEAVVAVFDTVKGAITEGSNVAIHGFGIFKIKELPARKGRNPKTGETMDIPASCKVTFTPSAEFKAEVKNM
jgi:DNA-binding protein HU-beta